MNFGGMIAEVCDVHGADRFGLASKARSTGGDTPRPRYLSRRRLGEGASEAALQGYALRPLVAPTESCSPRWR